MRSRQRTGKAAACATIGLAAWVACAAVSLGAQSRRRSLYAPPKTPGAIPTCKASGRAPTWSACRSSGRSSSAPACPSPTRSSSSGRRTPRSRPTGQRIVQLDNAKPEIVALGDVGGVTSPPPHWLERGKPSRQSSLIVDPPDGQMPPMTPEGQRRVALDRKHVRAVHRLQRSRRELGPYDRCISRGAARLDVPGRLQQRQPVHPGARAMS